MQQEKTTIAAAARALGVSQKTIYRYLSNGTLSRIREGKNTYILVDEVRTLRTDMTGTEKEAVRTKHTDTDRDTITIKLNEYKELLKKIGTLETQERYLLEYKAEVQQKEAILAEAKAALEQRERELEALREENERLKRPWYRRIIKRWMMK